MMKAKIVKSAERAVSRVRLSKHSRCYVMTATDMNATIEALLQVVFCLRSVPRLYDEGQLPFKRLKLGDGEAYDRSSN
jgi:hypothetical protein